VGKDADTKQTTMPSFLHPNSFFIQDKFISNASRQCFAKELQWNFQTSWKDVANSYTQTVIRRFAA